MFSSKLNWEERGLETLENLLWQTLENLNGKMQTLQIANKYNKTAITSKFQFQFFSMQSLPHTFILIIVLNNNCLEINLLHSHYWFELFPSSSFLRRLVVTSQERELFKGSNYAWKRKLAVHTSDLSERTSDIVSCQNL